jgi:hypothetical protein
MPKPEERAASRTKSAPPESAQPERVLRFATRVDSVDALVETFSNLIDKDSLFIITKNVLQVGLRRRFAVTLRDGQPVLSGEAEVQESPALLSGPGSASGLRLRLLRLTPASRALHKRMLDHKRERETTQVTTLPEPPAPGSTESVLAPESAPGETGAPAESAVPPSSFVLPANPLSELADSTLQAFVECAIFEDYDVPRFDFGELDKPTPDEPEARPEDRGDTDDGPAPATMSARRPRTETAPLARAEGPTRALTRPPPLPRAATPPPRAATPPPAEAPQRRAVTAPPSDVLMPPARPSGVLSAPAVADLSSELTPAPAVAEQSSEITPPPAVTAPPSEITPPPAVAAPPSELTSAPAVVVPPAILEAPAPSLRRSFVIKAQLLTVVMALGIGFLGGYLVFGARLLGGAPSSGRDTIAASPSIAAAPEAAKPAAPDPAPPGEAKEPTAAAERDPAEPDPAERDPAEPDPGEPDPAEPEASAEPAAAAAPSAATGACTASIESNVDDAQVSINGSPVGTGTVRDKPVPCGEELLITVEHPRKQRFEERVTASPGAPARVVATLRPPAARLTVISNPPGATLSVNGKVVGRSPATVDVKAFRSVRVTASLKGYKVWERRVRMSKSELTVMAALDRISSGKSR